MVSSVPLSASRTMPMLSPDPLKDPSGRSDVQTESGDSFERSAFAAMLDQLGLSSSSRLETTRGRVDFNFSFTASASESLTASGYIAQFEQTAAMTLTYTFQRAVVENGKRELKLFQADIAFQAQTSGSLSVKPFKEKEDITLFLNRLMKDIFDLLEDDSVVLTGITLDQKDLAEIMNLDHAKVKRLFDGLIAAIMTMAMLKRMKRGNEAGPNVVLNEKRRETEGVNVEKKSGSDFSFSISIKCLGAAAGETKSPASKESLPKAS